MNRGLLIFSYITMIIVVLTGSFLLLGYTIFNFAVLLATLPLAFLGSAIAILLALAILWPIIGWIGTRLFNLLARNNEELAFRIARHVPNKRYPPNWLFALVDYAAALMALEFVSRSIPRVIASPGILADALVCFIVCVVMGLMDWVIESTK